MVEQKRLERGDRVVIDQPGHWAHNQVGEIIDTDFDHMDWDGSILIRLEGDNYTAAKPEHVKYSRR